MSLNVNIASANMIPSKIKPFGSSRTAFVLIERKYEPMSKRINLAAPRMVGNERQYVKEAFDSNWIAPLGHFVNQLEEDVAAMVGSNYAVALSSGTAAIHLALIECGVNEGDIVFCSDLTFTASANPIKYCGATPVFIDSDMKTYGMSPKALRKAFEKYTPKAVIATSIYGIPSLLDELEAICEEHGVPMIEDSTEMLGCTINGKHVGTFGKFGTYSFNGNKIITTSGGGMLVSNDSKAISHALFLATQAKEKSPYYEHKEIGFNYRLSNISAAIGVGQLEQIDKLIGMKKDIFDRYDEAFYSYEDYDIEMLNVDSDCKSNYWLSVLVLGDASYTDPQEIVRRLADENIEARHVWKPMHTQELWKDCDFIKTTPTAYSDYLFTHGVCLPSDTNMTEEEQQRVISVIRAILNKNICLNYGTEK